jgi:2-keto-4-pentenoate hydratase/2-oxohepta-3-ene-1,7-dioic acid hydratase in catechol pathway
MDGDKIVDLLAAARGLKLDIPPEWLDSDINHLIAAGTEALKSVATVISRAHEAGGFLLSPADVRVLAPISGPSKIIAVGQNYMDHIREQGIKPPERPILFSKAPTSVIGPGDAITWPAGMTSQVDPEVELGVIIGLRTKGVPVAVALDCIFGYTVLNDVSARDVQFGDGQWVRGKSPDTFCPLGPVIVTRDEIPDPQNLKLSCAVNGRIWQDSNTKEMIFSVATLISFIAQGMTLLPGDVVATGTPNGVGVFQKPPVFLEKGDKLRLEVEKIGVLENPVAGPG